MNYTLHEWHSTSASWESMSRLWCDYSKTHNTGICQICAGVSADDAASMFSIAELGLDMGRANPGTRVRDWEVVKQRVFLRLMKTNSPLHHQMESHTFTSSDGGTHIYIRRRRHTTLRHPMKKHTFGFCISYLTVVFWSQFRAAVRLGNVVIRVTAAAQETP